MAVFSGPNINIGTSNIVFYVAGDSKGVVGSNVSSVTNNALIYYTGANVNNTYIYNTGTRYTGVPIDTLGNSASFVFYVKSSDTKIGTVFSIASGNNTIHQSSGTIDANGHGVVTTSFSNSALANNQADIFSSSFVSNVHVGNTSVLQSNSYVDSIAVSQVANSSHSSDGRTTNVSTTSVSVNVNVTVATADITTHAVGNTVCIQTIGDLYVPEYLIQFNYKDNTYIARYKTPTMDMFVSGNNTTSNTELYYFVRYNSATTNVIPIEVYKDGVLDSPSTTYNPGISALQGNSIFLTNINNTDNSQSGIRLFVALNKQTTNNDITNYNSLQKG